MFKYLSFLLTLVYIKKQLHRPIVKLDDKPRMLRLCVAGSGGVGKSSLTIRYLRDEFTEVLIKFSAVLSLFKLLLAIKYFCGNVCLVVNSM